MKSNLTVVPSCLKSFWCYYWLNFVATLVGLKINGSTLLFILVKHETRGPQALKVTCVPSLLDWHVRKYNFCNLSFLLKSKTYFTTPLPVIPLLLFVVWNTFNKKNVVKEVRFTGISDSVHVPELQGPNIAKVFGYWDRIWDPDNSLLRRFLLARP